MGRFADASSPNANLATSIWTFPEGMWRALALRRARSTDFGFLSVRRSDVGTPRETHALATKAPQAPLPVPSSKILTARAAAGSPSRLGTTISSTAKLASASAQSYTAPGIPIPGFWSMDTWKGGEPVSGKESW